MLASRRNDVLMPRTALVLWSFVMLVALVFAFTAGLLTGHFLWKPHTLTPPASSTAIKPSTASAEGRRSNQRRSRNAAATRSRILC